MSIAIHRHEGEHHHFGDVEQGSMPTITIIVAAVAAVGYVANIVEMSSTSGISDALRGFGVIFPPLGVILGFM